MADLTAKDKITTIKDALETQLPALLTAEGLDDFDRYTTESLFPSEEKVLAVYLSELRYNTDFQSLFIMIQLQLHREQQATEYHDVVMDAIVQYATPFSIDYDYFTSIESDVWPLNKNVSSSYVFYLIEYTKELDDCD